MMDFIVASKRNPLKYYAKEQNMHIFVNRYRRMINAGEMNEPRLVIP